MEGNLRCVFGVIDSNWLLASIYAVIPKKSLRNRRRRCLLRNISLTTIQVRKW